MVGFSNAPYPYRLPSVDRLEPQRPLHDYALWQDYRSLPAISSPTDRSWLICKVLLTGVVVLAGHEDPDSFGLPARLEFFRNDARYERGVVIFDNQGRMIVHVVHALLGYGGSGPYLSEQILGFLGVPEETFHEIQQAVWQSDRYMVVVSRQQHGVIEGVDAAFFISNVEAEEWTWWRAR